MALKPWTGIPTACTHWFSLLPQEKNRRRDRHGDGLLRPPPGFLRALIMKTGSQTFVPPARSSPHHWARAWEKNAAFVFVAFGVPEHRKTSLVPRTTAGPGVLLPSPGWALPILPGGRPRAGFGCPVFVLCAGGPGRPCIRLFKGFWARSTVDCIP